MGGKRKWWVLGVLLLTVASTVGLFYARAESAGSRAQYRVGKLTCRACVERIGEALRPLPGVGSVDVSVEAGSAVVEFDSSKIDPGRIAEAITATGYPATLERTLSADQSREEKKGTEKYVARIGNRLVERERFEAEIGRLQKGVPPDQAAAAIPRLTKLVWAELVQHHLLLADAEASGVKTSEEDVHRELQRLRSDGTFAQAVAREGGEENLRRETRERLTVQQHLERNLLSGIAPSLHQLRIDQRLRQISAVVPVEILDPALKEAVGAKGGCGKCC